MVQGVETNVTADARAEMVLATLSQQRTVSDATR